MRPLDEEAVNVDVKAVDADHYQCPSCSGPMVYNPTTSTLKCEYCDFEKTLEAEGHLSMYNFFDYEKEGNHTWGDAVKSLHCQSCGAHTHLSEKDVSTTCPFCGSKHVSREVATGGISPHAVVPFKLSRKEAYDRFNHWIKRRFFAKKAIKNARDEERLKGVYIPYWHFNIDASSHYRCSIGYNYTVTVTKQVYENGKSVTKQVQETRIRWETKMGHIDCAFVDMLSNASTQFNTSKINALEPFDFREAKPYDPGFLSGFSAERYSLSLNDGFEQLKPTIHNEIVEAIRRKHHGDHIRNAQLSTDFTKVDFEHVLLPIWLSSYLYRNKTYQFAINGQTGEVQGNYPLDWVRVLLVGLVIVALIAAYLIYQESNGGYATILQALMASLEHMPQG